MKVKNPISFVGILKRLKGVYVTLYILPNNRIDGEIKQVEDNGTVIFGLRKDMTTHVKFIKSVTISNEGVEAYAESPYCFSKKFTM